MSRADTAIARHNTYLLLSQLYLEGLTEDLLPYIVEIPELAAAAPRPFHPDEAAATHFRIFAHDIFPYESIFRDSSGLLGGTYADQVRIIYEDAGVNICSECDHIGQELAFLAALCKYKSRAVSKQDNEAASPFVKSQRTFLQEHLITWLPPFIIALSLTNQPFYAALSRMTQSLAFDHLLSLDRAGSAKSFGISDGNRLPDLPEILKDKQTSLKQIVRFLITPPQSGLYFGRSAISTIARKRQMPRGFGSRQQMFSNLFHAAAQYGQTPDLLHDLAVYAETWGDRYQEQIVEWPGLSPWIRPWLRRVNRTASALCDMKSMSISVN